MLIVEEKFVKAGIVAALDFPVTNKKDIVATLKANLPTSSFEVSYAKDLGDLSTMVDNNDCDPQNRCWVKNWLIPLTK